MRPYCFDNPTLYLRAQMSSPKNIEIEKKGKFVTLQLICESNKTKAQLVKIFMKSKANEILVVGISNFF